MTVYPVDGEPVTVDDLNWVIARLSPEAPPSVPVVPGEAQWEYTFGKADDMETTGGDKLGPGWEPFAVVEHAGESWVHLRRRVNGG